MTEEQVEQHNKRAALGVLFLGIFLLACIIFAAIAGGFDDSTLNFDNGDPSMLHKSSER